MDGDFQFHSRAYTWQYKNQQGGDGADEGIDKKR